MARARTRPTASASKRGESMASRASRAASGSASLSARKPPSKPSRSLWKERPIAASRSASWNCAAGSSPAPSVSSAAAMAAAPSCPSGSSEAPPDQLQASETTGTEWSSASQADSPPGAVTSRIGREKPACGCEAGGFREEEVTMRSRPRAAASP